MEVHKHPEQEKTMKTLTILFFCLVLLIGANAQQAKWVIDKENLLTTVEIKRIDSALQQYHENSGKFIIVCTDTADVALDGYAQYIYEGFEEIKADQSYVYILMMSRKHQAVISNVSKKIVPYINMEKLIKLMEPGFPLLKEQKREEAILVICNNAMRMLDGLPKE